VVEAGAKVTRSAIRGPAIIGRDTVVEGSAVGPFTSIASGCRLIDSEIENSIVMEQCVIEGVSGVADSLLGRAVTVRRGLAEPVRYRVIAGDQSQLEVP
jgi:glucose-1-phosphate thymidylyltransferase